MRDTIEKWYTIKEAIGLSCSLKGEGTYYSLCRIRRENDTIEVLDRKTLERTADLLSYLRLYKQWPIALHVQGKGILIKPMALVADISKEQIIPIFPNYNEEEYTYYYFPGQAQAWLTLAKKEMLEEVLNPFHEEKLLLSRLFIGPFVADNILDQLNGYSGHFSFDGHHISRSIEDKLWESYRYAADEKAAFLLKMQGLDIAESYVLAYASAFSLLMHRFVEQHQVSYPLIDAAFDDYLQRIKFKVNGLLLLAVFFVLLIINTLLYTHYQSQYELLNAQTQENFSSVNELQQLSNKVSSSDSSLLVLGWNGGLPKSWLLNQLAISLQGHAGVTWQSVVINPIAGKRFGTLVGESDNRFQIQLAGSCQTLNELEAWVRNLSHLYWLRTVEISRFIDQNKPNSNRKDFVVNMQYRYDF